MSLAAAPLARRQLGCCLLLSRLSGAISRMSTTTAMAAPAAASGTSPASTAAKSMPLTSRFHVIPTKDGRIRSAFAVYPPPQTTALPSPPSPATTPLPTITAAASKSLSFSPSSPSSSKPSPPSSHRLDVMRAYALQQIARMDPTGARTLLFSRHNRDCAKPGDVLLVTSSRAGAETFAGVCLSIRRAGIETAILLRGQLAKTGVERWFKVYSRSIASIDIVQRRARRARRARLTFMRQPKHDRGAVDEVVRNWRRSRNVIRTRGSIAAANAAAAAAAAAKAAKAAGKARP